MRKGSKIPYIAHLLAVSSLVLENGGSEDEAIAALLHDAAEDQGGAATLKQIRGFFGKTVAEIVEGCSDSLTDDRKQQKAPWPERKAAYIAHLEQCTNDSVLLVSAADKLHNLRSTARDFVEIGPSVWQKFNAERSEVLKYYRRLISAYRQGPKDSRRDVMVDEMRSIVDELERVQRHEGNRRIEYGFAFQNEPFDPTALTDAIFAFLRSIGADRGDLARIEFGGMPSEYRGRLYQSIRVADRLAERAGFDDDWKLNSFRNAMRAVLFSFEMDGGKPLGRTINAALSRIKEVTDASRLQTP